MAKNTRKAPISMPTHESQSVRIEKIQNGYLAHHSSEGRNGYHTKTVFHGTKPVIMAETPKKKGK